MLRLAIAGSRTDTLRVVLTAVSALFATVVMLVAANVLAIPGLTSGSAVEPVLAQQYRLQVLVEPGLRPGVAFALAMLTIPVLALAAQCGRLGAPARDRRLAAIRLAGATPGQAVWIAAAETGVASGLGSLLGLVVYLAGHRLLDRPDAHGQLLLPTDVLPAGWAIAAICLGLPLLATALAVVLLRHVAFTPYGVVRHARRDAPNPITGLPILVGIAMVVAYEPLARWAARAGDKLPRWMLPLLLFVGVVAAAIGLVAGTGWISHATGRLLHRFGRGPAALLAARRLMADPWSGSRTLSVLLVCVLFGAGAAGVRAQFAAEFAVRDERARWEAAAFGERFIQENHDFYFDTLDLVNAVVAVAVALAAAAMLVALAEGIVSRRRAYAAMVATGVSRGTLSRAVLLQALAPVVPAVLLALAVGDSLIRAMGVRAEDGGYQTAICTTDWSKCQDAASPYLVPKQVPVFVRDIPIPLGELAVLGSVAVLAVLAVTGIGLLFLRGATALEELRTT